MCNSDTTVRSFPLPTVMDHARYVRLLLGFAKCCDYAPTNQRIPCDFAPPSTCSGAHSGFVAPGHEIQQLHLAHDSLRLLRRTTPSEAPLATILHAWRLPRKTAHGVQNSRCLPREAHFMTPQMAAVPHAYHAKRTLRSTKTASSASSKASSTSITCGTKHASIILSAATPPHDFSRLPRATSTFDPPSQPR